MLLILTGDIETGKTTWLMHVVDSLTTAGVRCDGVLAPGVWERKDEGTLIKLGIDNLLLPQGELIPFARRTDLAKAEGIFDEDAQSAKAQLKWHIHDQAIARVNNHLNMLMRENAGKMRHARTKAQRGTAEKGCTAVGNGGDKHVASDANDDGENADFGRLLVIDELGQLELLRGEGLTSAVRMLEAGPCGIYRHAMLIARDKFGLVERAEQRFSSVWGGSTRIFPTGESRRRWIDPMMHAAAARVHENRRC